VVVALVVLSGTTLVLGGAVAPPAEAAGVTTHAWMALDAVPLVEDAELQALLEANLGQVEGGAQWPDSGYLNRDLGTPGGDYGEEAHWQRYIDAYAAEIRDDETCGDLTAADGPCAERIAHLMGALAHGIGDEVWDWLFEPQAPDRGESYLPSGLDALFSTSGLEVQMDICAIARYGRTSVPDTPTVPAPEGMVDAFGAVGRDDITVSGIEAGKVGMSVLRGAESVITPIYANDIATNMPWTSENLVTAPGGIDFGAAAIAPQMDRLWQALLGEEPSTEVGVTYPADGQTGVPATGWVRSFLPGSAPDRGGAENRIAATLTYSLPYNADADDTTDLPEQLPDGAMTLTNLATGELVPLQPGSPRAVPYGSEAGERMVGLQPAQDLEPCTEYRVEITQALLDANGDAVDPHAWTFRTGGCCEDPPTTFTDVAATHPFADDITWMAEHCTTTGYEDGTFRPGSGVTRQSMSAFLYRLAGAPIVPPPSTAPFSDVSTTHPFATEIAWMASTGISTGFEDGTYRPARAVTRQSMSAFLYRLAGEPDFTPPAEPRFSDVSGAHPFSAEVEWMAAEDVTTGFDDGTYRPGEVVTRQSMSAFMHRFADGPGVAAELQAVDGWPGV
jgi:hypothetical protein